MTTRTAKVSLSQIGEQLTDDDMDLGLKLYEDFAYCMTNRGADNYSVFCALAAIVESLSRANNLDVVQLTSSIGNFAAFLQAGKVSLELKND
jgi:hypothetical protein